MGHPGRKGCKKEKCYWIGLRTLPINCRLSGREWLKSKVSVVKIPLKSWDEEVFEGVRRSIDLIGGPERFAKPGEKVLIKPNIVFGDRRWSVDRRVLYSVAKIFVDLGCDVVIGENPLVNTNSREEFEKYGMEDVAKRAGARFVDFRRDEHVTVKVENARGCETLRIAKTVLDADCVVSVPVMRAHGLCMVSLSIKNLWGTIPPTQRHIGHRKSLNWTLAELNKIVGTKLAVIDGTTVMGAPHVGLKPLGVIIAGDDPVATDSIATIRMGYDPYRIEHIRYAHELGVGEIDPEKIEIIGSTLEEIREIGRKEGRRIFRLKGYNTDPRRLLKRARNVEVVMGNPCSSCLYKLTVAIKSLGIDKISEGPEMAIIVGPEAKPVPGKVNIILGGCLKKYADQGIFVDFCPVYDQDVKQGILMALGEIEEPRWLWERILESYRKKEDESLPGF